MRSGKMFSQLEKYKDKDFWKEHKLITLSTCEFTNKNGRFVVVAKRIA